MRHCVKRNSMRAGVFSHGWNLRPTFLQVNGYLLTSNSKTLREIREEEMESGTYSATIKCCSDGKKESLALSLVLDNCRCQWLYCWRWSWYLSATISTCTWILELDRWWFCGDDSFSWIRFAKKGLTMRNWTGCLQWSLIKKRASTRVEMFWLNRCIENK